MGFIRHSVVFVLSAVLFLTLFVGNGLLTLSWSLEYENISTQGESLALSQIQNLGLEETIDENMDFMNLYCERFTSFKVSEEGIDLEIPCDIIIQGKDAIINYSVSKLISDIYYKEYTCEFWDCLKQETIPLVLISEKAKDYWSSKYNLVLLITIAIFLLLFLAAHSKNSPFIITGVMMIASAFPYRKLNWILSLLGDGEITNIALSFFAKSYNVFITMTLIGAIILAIGIGFEIFGIGIKISEFLNWVFKRKKEEPKPVTKEEVKNIVTKAVKKSKESKTK